MRGGRLWPRSDGEAGSHTFRGRDPEQPERPGDCPLSEQAEAQPGLLHALALRTDDLTVPVEGVEVAGHLYAVGAEAVWGATGGGLGGLVGQLAEALDQRALRRLGG